MANIGANYLDGDRCQFRVWAPEVQQVELHLWPDGIETPAEQEQLIPMQGQDRGYHQLTLENVRPGSRYMYRLDGKVEYPDPASRFQPEGVHCASQVVNPHFDWDDEQWSGLTLPEYVIYELHVGTFTAEGTFEAIIPHLARLRRLGITALELMPLAQFPGSRNWGYDGTFIFAPQNSYGGPAGFKRLVNACHQEGLAVILDVVYNHFGPEGCYLGLYGPYFTQQYRTGWGTAVNLDGPYSDEVRNFFIQNALYWIKDFHVDALRIDAVHALFDPLAQPFLEELGDEVRREQQELRRQVYLIVESDLNNPRLIQSKERGGYGLDAQWNDDFHHVFESQLLKEQSRYYEDFDNFRQIAKTFSEGYVYTGQYSRRRRRRHGRSPHLTEGYKFIVFLQNHDQVGNRPLGSRLNTLVSFEELKVAVSLMLLSPFVPLIFMGEEYAETASFNYFVSFGDQSLIEAVREGRCKEFACSNWTEAPDPQAETTFEASRLQHHLRQEGRHRVVYEFYRELLRLRREEPALAHLSLKDTTATCWEEEKIVLVQRRAGKHAACLVCSLGDTETTLALPVPAGRWQQKLDTAASQWQGSGRPAPKMIDSDGTVEMTINPKTCTLWVLTNE